MKKTLCILFICCCAIFSITSCGRNTQQSRPPDATIAAFATESPTNSPTPIETSATTPLPTFACINAVPAKTIAEGANRFAFSLSASLAKDAGDKNFVCSPFSVWLPLSALVNATESQYKDDLIAALCLTGFDEAQINTDSRKILQDFTNSNSEQYNPLQIANAIFVGENITIHEDFMRTFTDYYYGNAMNVDFSSRDAVDKVNHWVSENTEGLIPEIIKEFPPSTVAAIANAIYFSDGWRGQFNPELTKEFDFHAPTGDAKASFMFREGFFPTYYEDEKVQALPLPFVNGGGLYIFLPKDEDAATYLSSMTNDFFIEIQSESVQAEGSLLLPRFSIESDVMDLVKSLEALGVPLFDESTAPLTGGLIEEEIPVWLSGAAHKALIKVDEKGTTAAAATVIGASTTSVMPQPKMRFTMNCNKPFAFILYDRTDENEVQVLFTGIVNQP